MKDVEFINYLPTPNDQYMLGIVTIRLYGKLILRLKHMNTKDHSGTFFAPSNYALGDAGAKRYVACFELDSKLESQLLSDFIRDNVNNVLNQQKTYLAPKAQPMAQSASIFENVPNLPF